MRQTKASVIVLAFCLVTQYVDAAEYQGSVVNIVDGDTFDIQTSSAEVRIRLCGVDSPERGHPGYRPAKRALHELIAGKTVHCVQVGSGTPCDGHSCPTSGKRIVAQCFLEKADIAAEMVRSDHACDWPWFSGGHYRQGPETCTNNKQPRRRCSLESLRY